MDRTRMTLGAALATLTLLAPATRAAGLDGFGLRGYGEFLYNHHDFGPNARAGDQGAPSDSRAELDLERLVLEVTYTFDEKLAFETEIEFEHGGVGAAMELEYEEFGEYETEVEKGGEVALEQMHLTRTFSKAFAVRAGHIVVPVGAVNTGHLPHQYFGSSRPEGERMLVPVVWHETGAEILGSWKSLRYELQVVSGLSSTGFSSLNWVQGGQQGRFERVSASDLAYVGRLDWRGPAGLSLGGAFYSGETSDNRPKPDMEDVPARLDIVALEAGWTHGPWRGRASWLKGWLEKSGEISRKNSRLSTNLGVPRTPVAASAYAWSVELGCDVLPWLPGEPSGRLLPFLRYEKYDSMAQVEEGFYDDPRYKRDVLSGGLNWEFHPKAVLKADCTLRGFGHERYRQERTLGLGLGWRFGG